MPEIVLVAAAASLVASVLITLTVRFHGRLSLDSDMSAVQKVHRRPVPRIGGLALFFGIAAAAHFTADGRQPDAIVPLLAAAVPAFVAGTLEDITKAVSVKARLAATLTSALLACWLFEASLPRLDIPGLDALLAFWPVSVFVTTIAVAGVANAINIVDGFHGFAGTAVIVMLSGIGALAWFSGDSVVVRLCLVGVGATLGFLVLNYPAGFIFMGDGGAYFLGFWVAEAAVLLVVRNSGIVTWQVLALCTYPVMEVLASMFRRRARGRGMGSPDRLHLHTLFYRRVVCQRMSRTTSHPWQRNAAVVAIVAAWLVPVATVTVLYGNTLDVAICLVTLQAAAYLMIYARLVHGRWWIYGKATSRVIHRIDERISRPT